MAPAAIGRRRRLATNRAARCEEVVEDEEESGTCPCLGVLAADDEEPNDGRREGNVDDWRLLLAFDRVSASWAGATFEVYLLFTDEYLFRVATVAVVVT